MVFAAANRSAIATDSGFSVLPSHDFTDAPPADLLCVPGGPGVAAALGDAAMRAFIARQAAGATWVTSVCTGAFLLGAAGLLAGKRATTHWGYVPLLARFGATPVIERVVEDGHTVTSGGVTSGIDFALALIARIAGEEAARSVQLSLEYDPAPPYDSGHPSRAEPATVATLKQRFYDAAAQRMAEAIAALPPAPA